MSQHSTHHIATFYRFVDIDDRPELQARLRNVCAHLGVTGTILIAPEGINATVAGSEQALCALIDELAADRRFTGITVKWSTANAPPFTRLKVRLRREIVTFGAPEANPAQRTGNRIPPEHWDALIAEPGVVLIDTRNAYEVAVGTFPGAIDPATASFGAFKDFVAANLDPSRDTKIAMFCTGGIRCEKASAYLLAKGFANVSQLEGGILKYLETIPAERSTWLGECYVFDRRVAVRTGLTEGSYRMCWDCGSAYLDGAVCDCTQ